MLFALSLAKFFFGDSYTIGNLFKQSSVSSRRHTNAVYPYPGEQKAPEVADD
jgi:hypothetical protein